MATGSRHANSLLFLYFCAHLKKRLVQKLPPQPTPMGAGVNHPQALHLLSRPGSPIPVSLHLPGRHPISTRPTAIAPPDPELLPPPLYKHVHCEFLPWLFLSPHLKLLALMRKERSVRVEGSWGLLGTCFLCKGLRMSGGRVAQWSYIEATCPGLIPVLKHLLQLDSSYVVREGTVGPGSLGKLQWLHPLEPPIRDQWDSKLQRWDFY